MKKLIGAAVLLLFAAGAFAQNTYKAVVKDAKTDQPLAGASVMLIPARIGTQADSLGRITISNVPPGIRMFRYTYLGYETKVDTVTMPLPVDSIRIVYLLPAESHEDLDEVVVSATRSSRTIDNIPTRVEVIAGEELDEKSNMKPGDIRMVLAESTGIQTQQTSATSANSSIRIQGLDGRYTQIIRDGFPLYSGFSGGLGLLQIAPLDLQQVEVVKGSASTLYGGGAIAGLVNLVSKKPAAERQLNVMLNGTSALGLDASMFYAEQFKKAGLTVYGAYNKGTAYDPFHTGLTAIPEFDRFTLNPKLFLALSPSTDLVAGITATTEKRTGGNISYVQGKASQPDAYFEKNITGRYNSQLELRHRLSERETFVLRNSAGYFDRSIGLRDYLFSGVQISTFSEATYNRNGEKADWVTGLNFVTEDFKEDHNSSAAVRSYSYSTVGAFVQNTWTVVPPVSIESGIRADYHNAYGVFVLPRLSALWKISEHVSTRLGGGLGYKAPTVFTEDAERIQFRNVQPIDVSATAAERSAGLNYDLNYRTSFFNGAVGLSINQLFFYTRINKPILLSPAADGNLQYVQPNAHIDTRGMESNVKITFSDFKLFVGYTFADVKYHAGSVNNTYPLVSRHRLNNVLMYELEDKWKIGAEAYYFSKQQLNDGLTGRSYWTTGFMIEKLWERFSIFLNFENFTNTSQTRFDTIYTGPLNNPVFRDIYAPVDGFVMNGGIKLRL
ncbi:TonB-dependent receptor [Pedobacter sp. SYP-B3415]|uniref:TonB-dependent receptor n=1 Tax=Pedobacter sp. SYP-B3415 TaxID=2496641 RepID=UPI00101D6228|nr:TonB-dependent receptor [Pedobacter sp. SYP-B3415]